MTNRLCGDWADVQNSFFGKFYNAMSNGRKLHKAGLDALTKLGCDLSLMVSDSYNSDLTRMAKRMGFAKLVVTRNPFYIDFNQYKSASELLHLQIVRNSRIGAFGKHTWFDV